MIQKNGLKPLNHVRIFRKGTVHQCDAKLTDSTWFIYEYLKQTALKETKISPPGACQPGKKHQSLPPTLAANGQFLEACRWIALPPSACSCLCNEATGESHSSNSLLNMKIPTSKCISGIHFHVQWSESRKQQWRALSCSYSTWCSCQHKHTHTHTHAHTHTLHKESSKLGACCKGCMICLLTFDPCTTPHEALPASEASLQHWPKSRWNHPLASGFGQMSQTVSKSHMNAAMRSYFVISLDLRKSAAGATAIASS